MDSAETVGTGANVFRGQVGYPGVWLDFIHGVDPTLDIGARFSFNYSFQGTFGFGCGDFCSSAYSGGIGLNFQFLLRKQFAEIGHNKLAFTFNPGLMLYFPPSLFLVGTATVAGIMLPIGLQMGFPVAPKWVINGSFELPMYFTFGGPVKNGNIGGAFFIPIMFGGGVEFLAMPNLDITFKLAMGPTIATSNVSSTAGAGAAFTLTTMVGVGYKF